MHILTTPHETTGFRTSEVEPQTYVLPNIKLRIHRIQLSNRSAPTAGHVHGNLKSESSWGTWGCSSFCQCLLESNRTTYAAQYVHCLFLHRAARQVTRYMGICAHTGTCKQVQAGECSTNDMHSAGLSAVTQERQSRCMHAGAGSRVQARRRGDADAGTQLQVHRCNRLGAHM